MKRSMMFLAAGLAAAAVFAEEEDDEKPVEAESAEKAVVPSHSAFTALPFCRRATPPAEVKKPGSENWEAVEEGRFYPLGSAYRTLTGGSMTVAFGPEAFVSVADGASFATRQQGLNDKCRAIVGLQGLVRLDLPRNLPEGAFVVSLPGFTLKNPAGSLSVDYTALGDGDKAVVRCVTGSLALEGRHFSIPSMRAANEVQIRSSQDNLETFLCGTSGDYIVKIDQGVKNKQVVDDEGAMKVVAEKGTLDWHLSPKTKVRISRAVPAIGERMSVAVMTFDAAGELKNNFAFAENRAEVNSGELVKVSKEDAEALAKRAAEATETTAAEDVDDGKKADEEDDSEKENKNKEKEDSDKE